MNCKFCNNFIPDEAKICPICGKNVAEETAMVERPANVPAPAPAPAPAAQPQKTAKKKSLITPLVIFVIGALAVAFLVVSGAFTDVFKFVESSSRDTDTSGSAESTGGVGAAVSDHDSQAGNYEEENIWVLVGETGLASVVTLGGAALFGKRAVGNAKAKKQ